MPARTLIATVGFDERHVLPALRLLPYDRLVAVGGRDAFRAPAFRRLLSIEPDLQRFPADAFPAAEAAIIVHLRKAMSLESLLAALTELGFARRTVMAAILSLGRKGLVQSSKRTGRDVVRPSPELASIRSHFAGRPGKA